MTSLASFLPAPKHATKIRATVVTATLTDATVNTAAATATATPSSSKKRIPRYGQRKGYQPREPEDFGDGGAFPEIHIAQYPLNMGRKKSVASHTQVVALATDAAGEAQFDVIIQSSDKFVSSKHSQLVPAQHLITQTELQKPDDDAVRDNTERTRLALERKLQGKANVTPLATAEAAAATHGVVPTFLRYTPASNNGVAQQTRIVKMVSAPVDPLEPPKFRHRKTIKAEGEAPVPVMHSPPRHVTAEDQQAWKIPPCISNWKNTKGYTIPLDKRLAADGRGLQEVTINDNFAKFAESLYIAEAASREEVAKRAAIQRKLAVNEKEATEDALRRLAAEARMKRAGLAAGADDDNAPSADDVAAAQRAGGAGAATVRDADDDSQHSDDDAEGRAGGAASRHDDPEKQERDRIRAERRRERERQIRMEAMGNRKSKLTRDDERDVSERIALGMQASSGPKETQYDQRLFNQSQGMTSGFGDDEAYNIFDGPLMKRGDAAKHIYRPTQTKDDAVSAAEAEAEYANLTKTDKFQPAKGFNGAESDGQTRVVRDGPVQFEKQEEEDPFGLDSFLLGAKNASNKDDDRSSRKRTFDEVGKRGHMAASGGGGSEGSGRSRVEFDESKRARR